MTEHFAFGENWASYAQGIGETQVAWSERSMAALMGADGFAGKSVVDVGCGSGLHSVAALRLGAASVLALDRDPASVATSRAVLGRFAPPGAAYDVREADVLTLDPRSVGRFDIVYSWGVLHHTGAMLRALERAAALARPGGLFAFALYRRTWLCPLWKIEKRWYSAASPAAQARARALYVALFRFRMRLAGGDFDRFLKDYPRQRGMDFQHDAHDWLGGYPYESIDAPEVRRFMEGIGFRHRNSNVMPRHVGVFGSGCDEYVYERTG